MEPQSSGHFNTYLTSGLHVKRDEWDSVPAAAADIIRFVKCMCHSVSMPWMGVSKEDALC